MPTRRSLRDDLIALGVRGGDLLMVHAGLRAVGRIVGRPNVLVQAMLDTVGPTGTVSAYIDYETFCKDGDDPDDVPVFDPRIAQASRSHSYLHEVMRNWPGTLRSAHPDAGVIAMGPRAAWLVDPHPFQYGYGPGTPFGRIVEAGGRVLMIGAPLETITLLHHAEHLARIGGKRLMRYRRKMLVNGVAQWVEFEEFDTTEPVCSYLPENVFERIALSHLEAGFGHRGKVGGADSYLFEARELVPFAVEWLERFEGASIIGRPLPTPTNDA